MKKVFRLWLGGACLWVASQCVGTSAAATQGHIEEVRVSANRLPIRAAGQSSTVLDSSYRTSLRLDDALKQVPGIGLFRRASSLTAHPTTQGLSARGVGANGAGRVLVTLDGVPLNNPFGGWVYWSALSNRDIDQVDVRQGGSASAFGPQGLAGTVSMSSVVPEESGGYLATEYGEFNSYSVSGGSSLVTEHGYINASGGLFQSDGPYLLSRDQRGSVDVPAASRARHINLRGSAQLSQSTQGAASLRYFDEERTNGLAAATNNSDSFEGSFRILSRTSDSLNWELLGYYRRTDLANIFASARDGRTTARPVLDQFAVPATGSGLLARVQFNGFEVGVEGRQAEGETNERFRNLGQGFTRMRVAGGEQRTLGVFTDYHQQADWGGLGLSARLDRYRMVNGQRREQDLGDGALLREESLPNRSGYEFSGRAGLSYYLTPTVTLNSAIYRSWRLPTINELYRPFRVVNDITEAYGNLVPEALYGAELGLEIAFGQAVNGRITYYRNRLENGVGNITLGFGPGFFPQGGFVPTGGVLRQRANIDRTEIEGVELQGEFQVGNNSELFLRYLHVNSRIRGFAANPQLLDKRPVQTPENSLLMAFRWGFPQGWLSLQGRYSGSQFDDDLNQRKLPAVFTANLAAAYQLDSSVTLSMAVENLFDRKVVSALTATGLETLAQQRFWRVGLEMVF